MKLNTKLSMSLLMIGVASCCVADQLSDRLIGWWRIDDATNATVLVDSSGNGRNATFGSGMTIVENGRFGRAAHFNGTGDAWARFANPQLTDMTIAAWVFMQDYNNILPRIMQIGGNTYCHMPQGSPGQLTLGVQGNDWTSTASPPFKFETNRWFHAAVVYHQRYTSATDRVVWPVFYVNGVRSGFPISEKAFISAIPAGNAHFGNNNSNGVRPLEGFMDDVRLYSAALSDRDILAIYQNSPLQIDAGTDQTTTRDSTALQGRLISTNSFMNTLEAELTWSIVAAPPGGAPAFETPWLPRTQVTLPETGSYTFRLTAVTHLGTVTDEVTVTRDTAAPGGNSAPVITPAFTSAAAVLGTELALETTVSDDAIPGTVRLFWSKRSGPGAVFFANPFAEDTLAAFSTSGVYTVRLEADDGYAQSAQDITVTVSLPAGDLSEGLEHWWRMDDDPALYAASDSAASNDLTLRYQAFLQPGRSGHALRPPRIDAAALADHPPTNAPAMTFCAWIHYDGAYVDLSTGNRYQRIFHCGGPNFYILYDPTIKKLTLSTKGVGTGSTQHTWTWNALFEPRQWYHIAILFNREPAASGSRQTLYVNGEKVLSNPYNTAFPGASVWSGDFIVGNLNAYGSGTRNFDGVIDEARIYSRFITDEEALLLAVDPGINYAPVIEVTESRSVKTGESVALAGTVTDDGRPDFGALSTAWSVIAGDPDAVLFADATDPASTAVFTRSGAYTLLLSATDGELQSATVVTVTATPAGTLILVY